MTFVVRGGAFAADNLVRGAQPLASFVALKREQRHALLWRNIRSVPGACEGRRKATAQLTRAFNQHSLPPRDSHLLGCSLREACIRHQDGGRTKCA